MKLAPIKKLSTIALLAILAWANPSRADDTATRLDYVPHFGENGWDVKLGAGIDYYNDEFYLGKNNSEIEPTLLGGVAYRNGRFYFVLDETENFLFGYNLMNKDQWVLDAVFGPKFGMYFSEAENADPRLKHLDDRDVDFHLGGRASYYGINNRTSFSVTKDTSGSHSGYTASLEYLHQWQIKNFLLTGRTELGYFSEQLVNHMVGVKASEATPEITEYHARAGTSMSLSLKLEYPISENWVFETFATASKFDDEVKNSPIVDNATITDMHIGLVYQFGDE